MKKSKLKMNIDSSAAAIGNRGFPFLIL